MISPDFLGNRAESSILALLSEPRGEREQSQADMGSQSLPRSLQLGDRCLLLGGGGVPALPRALSGGLAGTVGEAPGGLTPTRGGDCCSGQTQTVFLRGFGA